jgi:hypothetical protein
MTRKKLVFVSMMILFVLVTLATISTLAIPSFAGPTPDIKTEGGNWESVCCGKECGGDHCEGNGTYTCCK